MRIPPSTLTACVLAVLLPAAMPVSGAELDRCTCQVKQEGATSTLAGGTCTRTESDYCLMEWGSSSTSSVNVGDGRPQVRAIADAYGRLTAEDGSFQLFGLDALRELPLENIGPDPETTARAQEIIRMSAATRFDRPEEFLAGYVLLAAAALSRFDAPIDLLATLTGPDYRDSLVSTLTGEPAEPSEVATFDGLAVRASGNCLVVEFTDADVLVVVKGPNGDDELCK